MKAGTSLVLAANALLILGCTSKPMDSPEASDDFLTYPVQAALYVIAMSDEINLSSEVDRLLVAQGCKHDGDAWLMDGTPAGSTYTAPNLTLSVYPQRDQKVDVRLFYHRKSPEELKQWLSHFLAAMAETPGIKFDLYEPVSTGPF